MRLSPISLTASPSVTVPPEPRRPLVPKPKHLRADVSSTAQECATPATTARTLRPVPREMAESASPSSSGWFPSVAVSPVPRRPLAPLPQHLVLALSSTTQVCEAPALIATAVRPKPSGTATSAEPISPASLPMSSSAPLPSRPVAPTPQHTTSFVSRIAQVCAAPALIAFAVRPAPRSIDASDVPISPGSSPREFSSPVPRRPLAPEPQHFTLPFDASTHVCASPAAIAVTRTPAAKPSDTAGSASPISPAASPRASVSPMPS